MHISRLPLYPERSSRPISSHHRCDVMLREWEDLHERLDFQNALLARELLTKPVVSWRANYSYKCVVWCWASWGFVEIGSNEGRIREQGRERLKAGTDCAGKDARSLPEASMYHQHVAGRDAQARSATYWILLSGKGHVLGYVSITFTSEIVTLTEYIFENCTVFSVITHYSNFALVHLASSHRLRSPTKSMRRLGQLYFWKLIT